MQDETSQNNLRNKFAAKNKRLEELNLLDEFVLDLCECAADPTEDNISAFHGKYDEAKRQEIKEAIPLQTWGDKEIFTKGIDILQQIGAGASLAVVRKDLKKAVIDHFMADFFACAANPSLNKIADLYNDYNNKLVHIKKIIGNPTLIDGVETMFDKINEYCEPFIPSGDIISPTSSERNFLLVRRGGDKKYVSSRRLASIYYLLCSQLLSIAAQYDKDRFGKAAADACLQYCTMEIPGFRSDLQMEFCDFYSRIFLLHRQTIAEHLTSEQMSKITQIYADIVSTVTTDSQSSNHPKAEPQIEYVIKLLQYIIELLNMIIEKLGLERPKFFTEMVGTSRSNDNSMESPSL